ncbi:DUF3800 domain-containing protein [Nocardioides daphniae]|uniref:DUF3800 domain-containing protein n=1 Tax=Nocardioides daphniae TaxID=402297 RepID=A0A4P7UGC1_9ACTN|nr:DUF3800 domain-containing protein [Nocardioides daphniae]QCC78425.1 DUF3800 domain-containing protein [Nocardioides daphniae]GGD12552.1 hypothetical protein GCM10007231_09420 [Nocardioides daphniae]
MGNTTNIYCDESCHLPDDGQRVMVLGAVTCPVDKSREVSQRLREIRERHHLPAPFEVKWTKVSPAKFDYYRDLVDYFFDDDDLKFRAVVAPKEGLNHAQFDQTHDDWYYKMMYQLLTRLLVPGSTYRIYLDKKDTRSGEKVDRLHRVLSNSVYDFDRRIVERVQIVQSHDVAQLQLADLLLGAISYVNRHLDGSRAKLGLVDRIRERSGYDLTRSTLLREEKFNIFHWRSA